MPVRRLGAHDPGPHAEVQGAVGISLQQIIPRRDLGLLLSDSLLTFKGTWKSHFFVKPNFQMLATSFTLYSPSHCAGERTVSLCQPWTKGFTTLAMTLNSKFYFTHKMYSSL